MTRNENHETDRTIKNGPENTQNNVKSWQYFYHVYYRQAVQKLIIQPFSQQTPIAYCCCFSTHFSVITKWWWWWWQFSPCPLDFSRLHCCYLQLVKRWISTMKRGTLQILGPKVGPISKPGINRTVKSLIRNYNQTCEIGPYLTVPYYGNINTTYCSQFSAYLL